MGQQTGRFYRLYEVHSYWHDPSGSGLSGCVIITTGNVQYADLSGEFGVGVVVM